MNNYEKEARKLRTAFMNKLQKKYPGSKRQHGLIGYRQYSVTFFDKKTHKYLTHYDVPNFDREAVDIVNNGVKKK